MNDTIWSGKEVFETHVVVENLDGRERERAAFSLVIYRTSMTIPLGNRYLLDQQTGEISDNPGAASMDSCPRGGSVILETQSERRVVMNTNCKSWGIVPITRW